MKRIYAILGVMLAGLSLDTNAGSSEKSTDLLVRYHFAGTELLRGDTNTAKLKAIWALPATIALRDMALNKLVKAPQGLFRQCLETGSGDQADLIRPLLEDLIGAESYGQIYQGTNDCREWTLALRLNETRAQIWLDNLKLALTTWKAGPVRSLDRDGVPGWEIKMESVPRIIRLARVGSWSVMGFGPESMSSMEELIQQIKKYGNPPIGDGEAWLSARVEWPRLAPEWRPWLFCPRGQSSLPAMELSVSSKADNVRTKLLLHYGQPQQWSSEPWQMPTNFMRDPIISFTAVRGINSYFQASDFVKRVGIQSPPNQLYLWALSQVPFQTFGAVPMAKASNVLEQLSVRLPPLLVTNFSAYKMGEIRLLTNRSELLWSGLPVITPFLQAIHEHNNEYLVGGFFPASTSTNPPPAELIAQVAGRADLQYYDWEITQERLVQLWVLSQWYDLISPIPGPYNEVEAANAKARAWLLAVAPLLGNAATEVVSSSPTDLVMTRKSHCGFTGLELVLLSRLLDDQRFPLFGYALPSGSNVGSATSSSK